MDLQDFIEKFAEQFVETDPKEFKASTEFKKLVDWNSMTALSVIAMVDDEYGITMKGEDIRKSGTVHDMFKIVSEREDNVIS